MEGIFKIVNIFECSSRNYTDRQGQEAVFMSRGYLLNNGTSSVFAEVTGQNATISPFSIGDLVTANLQIKARQWTDSKGNNRYSNEITIQSMGGLVHEG